MRNWNWNWSNGKIPSGIGHEDVDTEDTKDTSCEMDELYYLLNAFLYGQSTILRSSAKTKRVKDARIRGRSTM